MRGVGRRELLIGAAALGSATCIARAAAASTEWEFVEVYSSADGSVQFIELYTTFPAQEQIDGRSLFVNGAVAFTFAENLPSPQTAGRHVLIATEPFAALPGVPTPDVVLPPGSLFPVSGIVSLGYGQSGAPPVLFDQVVFVHDWDQDCGQSLNWPGAVGAEAEPESFTGERGALPCCPCEPPLVCNMDRKLCVECLDSSHCPPGFRCDEVLDRCVVVGRPAPASTPLGLSAVAVGLALVGLLRGTRRVDGGGRAA